MAFIDRFRRRPEEEGAGGQVAAAPAIGTGPIGTGNPSPTGREILPGMMQPADIGVDVMTSPEALGIQPIGVDQIREAMLTLRRYKAGKSNFEKRVIENEEWWKMRHWNHIKEKGTTQLKTKSAWLVNVILSKHADAMDATPEPNCLPRMRDDEDEAQILSKVVPVVMQQNDFDITWSDNWWKKLKAGCAIYGVYWDASALNGLGDIAVRKVDPLSIYWEPGVTDLQRSRNIFHVELVDNELLEEEYPELKDQLGEKTFTKNEYLYDDTVDTTDKSAVIDWYYKRKAGGREVLHYVKFVGEHVLYATENEADTTERGLYDHGLYPFFVDVLFPEEGTPTGYGYIDICKDSQRQIDLMNNAIVANCIAAATPRWLVRQEGSVNEEEYADWSRAFVHFNGQLSDNAIQPVPVQQLTGNYIKILDQKVQEMKETSGNRDVNNGGTASGVTAASAIAAMQEQSGKLSRDQIQSSYNCYRQIVLCVIELIRQFYDAPRSFRILGPDGAAQYVEYDNRRLQIVNNGIDPDLGAQVADIRKPVFDIEVNAQKQSAYNKMSQNELALQFYQLGFFNPEACDQALACLDMMDFRGKEKVRQRVEQNGGMMQMIQQLMMMLQGAQGGAGAPMGQGGEAEPAPGGDASKPVKMRENDANGDERMQNRYVDRAKAQAQAATQPR